MVGRIGLGCMGMTGAYGDHRASEEECLAVIHRAVDLGITLFDTADVYGPFVNEILVGKGLADLWKRATIATKVGLVAGDGSRPGPNGDPEHIRRACDASLRRLRAERLHLYQLHRVDPKVPLEDSWGAMAKLVGQGKVGAIGLSEVTVEQCDTAHAIHPVASVQSELSLWTRLHQPVLEWCAAHGAAFLPFAPLGRGFLTGKLATTTEFSDGDFRARNPRFTAEAMAANQTIVDAIAGVAAQMGATTTQVALAWVLAQGDHVIPIPGTKRLAYLEENAGADAISLTPEAMATLASLPEPSGSRY